MILGMLFYRHYTDMNDDRPGLITQGDRLREAKASRQARWATASAGRRLNRDR